MTTNLLLSGNQEADMPPTTENAPSTMLGSQQLAVPDFDAVYESMVDYVWSAVCRMGVHGPDAEDVVQEVFAIVTLPKAQ